MQTRYIDTRPRAPSAVFELLTVHSDHVRLGNTESRNVIVVEKHEFNSNYEAMKW